MKTIDIYCTRLDENYAKQLSQLFTRAWTGLDISEEIIRARAIDEHRVRELMKEDLFLGASLKGSDKIVGVCRLSSKGGVSEVKHMSVDPEYQRRGIGTALTVYAIDEARKKGSHKIIAHVIPTFTASIKILEKLEFEREGYFKDHWVHQDFILYSKIMG